MELLQINSKSPSFKMLDINDNIIALDKYIGTNILLTFFRTASCPFCNLRVHRLIQKSDYFKNNNIQVICFFASSKNEILKYAGKQLPNFPIIADESENIYRKYKIQSSNMAKLKTMKRLATMIEFTKKGFLSLKAFNEQPILPADFLINTNGSIDYCYYGKDMGDHLGFFNEKQLRNKESSTRLETNLV